MSTRKLFPKIKLLASLSMLLIVSIYIVTTGQVAVVHADDNLQNKIEQYRTKLGEIQKTKTSLKAELQLVDTKQYLTSLQITETKNKIDTTKKEAEILTARINTLDQNLDKLVKLFAFHVVEDYKKQDISLLELMLSSDNAADLSSQVKYLDLARASNQQLVVQTQETKNNFEQQKDVRKKKEEKLTQLQVVLAQQQTVLKSQEREKQSLIAETQNDENKYQQLLQAAMNEAKALDAGTATGIKEGPVKKGDVIGFVGNSGYPNCSTGAHLHMEVRLNGGWVDPFNYLESKTLNDDQEGATATYGGGSWRWPLDDSISIEQHFGHTPWSWRYSYSGGIHTGVDMVSSGGSAIHAPADGTLFSSTQGCAGSSNINIKFIDVGGGVIIYFLHLQ